jgi:hypothetical protein
LTYWPSEKGWSVGFLVRQVVFTAPDDAQAAAVLESGPKSGIVCDPGPVGLWKLESILTGRNFRDVMRDAPDPVALFEGGQRVVLPLGDAARDALARRIFLRRLGARARWARTEEVRAEGLTRAVASHLVRDLKVLARTAQADQSHLYLWIDVDPIALG